MEAIISKDECLGSYKKSTKYLYVRTGFFWGFFMFVFYLIEGIFIESTEFGWKYIIITFVIMMVGGAFFGILFSFSMKKMYNFMLNKSYRDYDEILKRVTDKPYRYFLPCSYKSSKISAIGGLLFINNENTLFIPSSKRTNKKYIIELINEDIKNICIEDGNYSYITKKLYRPAQIININTGDQNSIFIVPNPEIVCKQLKSLLNN